QAGGGVTISGTYSGNVYLEGSATIYGHDKSTDTPETKTLVLPQGDFSPNPMSFPGQSQSAVVNNPQVSSNFCQPLIDGYTYWVAASNTSGCFTGACLLANTTITVSVSYGSNQMFQLIMEMPLFNDTTLGTTVYCAPTTAPCGLPLQGFYDFVFVIAIILAGGGFLVALANKQLSGDERQNVVLDFVIAVLFILLFPVIYNNIALLTNYLDMTIVAGPNLPYNDYSLQINLVWGKLLSWAQGGGIWGLLVSPITSVAGWIVALIVYLMGIFLGIIRIWLITVMVIGFPISLALKQIPFARKLSSMVEDTLYGLILASIMSSIAIGVAAYVLADSPGGPIWSHTIFAGTGINGISNWVAASALFTAVLIPTVFAPLTGTIFQTASQAAMVGVGVAASMAGAAAAPVAGAAGAGLGGMGALGGMGKGMTGAAASGTQTMGQAAAGKMQSMGLGERLLYAAPHSLKNVVLAGTTGILSAMGAYGPAKAITTVTPFSSSARVSQGIGMINVARQEGAQEYESSLALQDANQKVGGVVFNAVTAAQPSAESLVSQAPALNRWHSQQSQMAPVQLLSQLRQNHIINVQQYHALRRDPAASAELAETYKQQLNMFARDSSGSLTQDGLAQAANLRDTFQNWAGSATKIASNRNQPELGNV
ncbi:MAG TPA: hypothetical protein VEH01_00895, partial [Nitrososphaerales archaeon]|nr:hypothetical protein [Nitrososphaerales archaeon]